MADYTRKSTIYAPDRNINHFSVGSQRDTKPLQSPDHPRCSHKNVAQGIDYFFAVRHYILMIQSDFREMIL